MPITARAQWNRLADWSPWLFVLAALFLLVGAANSGLAYLIDGYAFDRWYGLVLELGRLAALLGTAGVAVEVVDRNATLGNLGRAVASLAVVAVSFLLALATLEVAGVLGDPIGLIGLLAYVLSVSAFLVVGVGVLLTGHSRSIGALLLCTVLALLVVFFGRQFVTLDLVATVVPGLQVLVYLGVAYELRAGKTATTQSAPASSTAP